MKLIVGLGNPGKKYEKTRHNLGFMAVDGVAEKYNGTFQSDKRFNAEICQVFIDGEKVYLAKPQTYMNLSGNAVQAIVSYFDISTDRVWTLYDDIDVELGTVRVRSEGSSGGHKGLQSIIDHLGTNKVARFRMGIKTEFCDDLATEDIVLKNFSKSEEKLVKESIEKTIKLVEDALRNGIEHVSV